MNKTLIIFTIYIVTIILLIIIFVLRNSKQNKKLSQDISELEKEKNLIINSPILNELSKVEALVKDDKLKYKYDNWQHKFDDIRNIYIPKITDMLLEADDLVSRKKYKELRLLLADIELKIYKLKEKTNNLFHHNLSFPLQFQILEIFFLFFLFFLFFFDTYPLFITSILYHSCFI